MAVATGPHSADRQFGDSSAGWQRVVLAVAEGPGGWEQAWRMGMGLANVKRSGVIDLSCDGGYCHGIMIVWHGYCNGSESMAIFGI